MSRLMVIGTLAVLLVLLGVMQLTLRKETDPPTPPSPDQQRAMAAQRAKGDREQETMRMKQMQAMQQKMKQVRNSHSAPAAKAPVANKGIEVSDNWFIHGSDGAKGIEQAKQQQTPVFSDKNAAAETASAALHRGAGHTSVP